MRRVRVRVRDPRAQHLDPFVASVEFAEKGPAEPGIFLVIVREEGSMEQRSSYASWNRPSNRRILACVNITWFLCSIPSDDMVPSHEGSNAVRYFTAVANVFRRTHSLARKIVARSAERALDLWSVIGNVMSSVVLARFFV